MAIVEDTPGVTRDRIVRRMRVERPRRLPLVDTGGIEPGNEQ